MSYVCTYELREHDDAVTSTGRLTLEEAPVVGESLRLGETQARIEDVRGAGNGELHLTLRAG